MRREDAKKSDLVWKEKYKHEKDKLDNYVQYWYAVFYDGDYARMYYIIPQYKIFHRNSMGVSDMPSDYSSEVDIPELYIYHHAYGIKKSINDDKENPKFNHHVLNDDYVYEFGKFKRALYTLEDAKDYAFREYRDLFY